jgi:hypothetical protein
MNASLFRSDTMLRAKRDSIGGPQGSAIPSLGEFEGRAFVLRVMATVSLTRLLRRRDANGQTELIKALQRTIERKCARAKLPGADIAAASKYAKEMFDEALDRAGRSAAPRQ